MNWPIGYQEKIEGAFGCDLNNGIIDLEFPYEGPIEGKIVLKKIRLIQKELRLIKKQLNSDMSLIRANFKEEKQNVNPNPLLVIFGGARSDVARKRQSIERALDFKLQSYKELKNFIDRAILEIDKAKVGIDLKIIEMKNE
ncbi:MAG: hypothetical protein K8R40_01050 [Anaerolineaceae bacterium]|nr:hypothetical protein [Anaerolineaceae bacterium]